MLASWSEQPRADSLEISRFLPCFLGKMTVLDKTEPLVVMVFEALSLLPSRQSCPTRHAFAPAVKTEVSNEKELRESHANGAHGETELPDEMELHNETEVPD